MRKYRSQAEFEAEIKDGVFISKESIDIADFNLDTQVRIEVAGDIKARDINARDITAGDIKAWDIKARDINAGDIKARDINAWDINAKTVSYYAVAFAYNNIKVKSIKGQRINSRHFVLDGKLEEEA